MKAFIDFIGSVLVQSSPNNQNNPSNRNQGQAQSHTHTSSLTIEIIRTMREAGLLPVLSETLGLIELEHPEACNAINSIIKPLEVLSRSIPITHKKNATESPTGVNQVIIINF